MNTDVPNLTVVLQAVFRRWEILFISRVEYGGGKNGNSMSPLTSDPGRCSCFLNGKLTRISPSTVKVKQVNMKVTNVTFLCLPCSYFLYSALLIAAPPDQNEQLTL